MKTSNYSTVLTVTTDPLSLDTPILDVMGTITYNSAVINWLPVDNAQGYKIYLENIDDTLVILDDLDVNNVTTYTLTGLYQKTNYEYKVKAYYHTVESSYSVVDDFVTADFVILSPTINANSDLTFDSVRINWTKRSNATSYKIYLENTDTTTVILNSVDVGDVDTYLFDGLDSSSNYLWKIKSYNSVVNEESSYSSNQTFTTLDPIPDVPIMSSSTSITSSSFVANWSAETYADSYNVYVYTDIDLTSLFVSYTGVLTNSKSVTGLTATTNYYTVVESVNESGVSAKSAYQLTSTIALFKDVTTYGTNTKQYLTYQNNLTDNSSFGNNATNSGATFINTGVFDGDNYHLSLDGVDDYTYTNDASSLDITSDLTIEEIFEIDSTTINSLNVLLFKGDTSIPYESSYELQYRGGDSPKRFLVELDDGFNYTNIFFDYDLPSDTIKKVTFTWDNTTKTPKLYVNKTELTAYQNIPWSGGIAYSTITNIRTTNAKVLRGRYEESTTFGASKIKYYRSAIHDVIKDKTTSDLDCDTFDLT